MDYVSKLQDGNNAAVEPLIKFNEGKFVNVRLWGTLVLLFLQPQLDSHYMTITIKAYQILGLTR